MIVEFLGAFIKIITVDLIKKGGNFILSLFISCKNYCWLYFSHESIIKKEWNRWVQKFEFELNDYGKYEKEDWTTFSVMKSFAESFNGISRYLKQEKEKTFKKSVKNFIDSKLNSINKLKPLIETIGEDKYFFDALKEIAKNQNFNILKELDGLLKLREKSFEVDKLEEKEYEEKYSKISIGIANLAKDILKNEQEVTIFCQEIHLPLCVAMSKNVSANQKYGNGHVKVNFNFETFSKKIVNGTLVKNIDIQIKNLFLKIINPLMKDILKQEPS